MLDEDQHRALTYISFANRGGNRPNEAELHEWMTNPRPKPAERGPLIRPGRPAKYRRVGGVSSAFEKMVQPALDFEKLYADRGITRAMLAMDLTGILGTRELVDEEVPPEYGPDVPAEKFADHLIRLGWVERDSHGGLALTPLGRSLLRSAEASENESGAYDVVVLDANNELSYPILVQKLAEVGDAILIDPYLRVDQLLAVRAYTTVSRVLVSNQLSQEDRIAMAVLVENSTDQLLELRMADRGVLHDRMVLGERHAFTIGTSINTVGKQHPTVLTPLPEVAADAMRRHAHKWWNDAKVIAVSASEVDKD